jgi:hypothetical protein
MSNLSKSVLFSHFYGTIGSFLGLFRLFVVFVHFPIKNYVVKSCKDFNADSIYSPENVSFTPNKAAPISHFESESEIDFVEIGEETF